MVWLFSPPNSDPPSYNLLTPMLQTITLSFKRIGQLSILIGLGLLLCSLFLFTTRTFQTYFTGPALILEHWTPLLIITSLSAIVVGAVFQRVSILSSEVPSSNDLPRTFTSGRSFFAANLALAALLFVLVALQFNSPLDIDENIHATAMARGEFSQQLNPINTNPNYYTQNHVLSQLGSILSIKLFGLSKASYRAPSLVLTFGLLTAFFFLSSELASSFILSLILMHLLVNQTAQWYLHSARGYVAMLFLCVVTFLIALDFSHDTTSLTPRRIWLFVGCFLASAFTHLFCAIFNVVLFFALLFWTAANRSKLDTPSQRSALILLAASILTFPVIAFVAVHNLIFLSRVGDLNAAAPANWTQGFMGMLGLTLTWQLKLVILLALGLVVHGCLNSTKRLTSLPSLFLAVSAFVFFLTLAVLKVRILEARFLLPFSIPLLIWMGEMTQGVFHRSGRLAIAFAVGLVLIASPALSFRPLYQTLSHGLTPYDEFLTTVRRLTSVSRSCYTFIGQQDLSIWAKDFYLHDSADLADCANHYWVRFPDGNDPRFPPLKSELPTSAKILFENASGMALLSSRKK